MAQHDRNFCLLSARGVSPLVLLLNCILCSNSCIDMLIFYTNLGQGGQWYIGPLLMLLPLLLGGGFLPFNLLSLLLGGGLFSSTTYVYDSVHGWQQVQTSASAGAGWLGVLLGLAALSVGLLLIGRQMRRHGVIPTLRRLFLTGWRGGGGGGRAGQQQQRRRQPGGQRGPGTRQERFERVTQLVQALPTEVYRSREELEAMSVGELKALLAGAGIRGPAVAPLEKRELVEALQSGANSSAASCSICCEDYQAGGGDVLRVLPCGHRYHLVCIDRWLLASTDYSRPPACPMCNAELGAPARAAGEGEST